MHIGEVSRLFQINRETIRYYRDQGILNPRQQENGYFDYTVDDLAVLFQVMNTKRTYGIFAAPVRGYLEAVPTSPQEIVRQDADMIERIGKMIHGLTLQRNYLLLRKKYRESLLEGQNALEDVERVCGLYYLELPEFDRYPEITRRLCASVPTYQSVVIPREAFLSPGLDTLRPAYALGFTDVNYQKTPYYQGCALACMHAVPDGCRALRFTVQLKTLNALPRAVFAPVDAYMAREGLGLIAPVTSIILSAAGGRDKEFVVMFRFLVEKQRGEAKKD